MTDKNLVKELEEEFRMFDAEEIKMQKYKEWELHLERIRESKNQEEENVNKLRLVKELEEAFQQFYGGSMGRLVIR